MVWSQLYPNRPHIAYAVLACFAAFFSLFSSVVKEQLYLGEAVLAAVYGLIVGPHCLKWFNPLSWTPNNFLLTLELSRIIICLDIFVVGIQLPKKYMKNHFWSVMSLLLPVMIIGWLVIGAITYVIFPKLNFTDGLLIAATITATDPVLATAVVGGGKFGSKVPAHIRNLLIAESAANDGLAVPFVYLALNLVLHSGDGATIAKNFVCLAVLWQCCFGCILGGTIGYLGRKLSQFASKHGYLDREAILVSYIILTFMVFGFSSILGCDDLLASFAAGCAFAWDGWVSKKTEGSDASSVIDLLLNISYFVYLGAIIPWQQFNDVALGLPVWRMVVLGIAVILLRRLPAMAIIKPMCPDIKSWPEAIFVGHFGPIGVGAVFASILAISELEAHILEIPHGPVANYPDASTAEGEHLYYLIHSIWPIVCFLIVVSIIVHGSSPAIMMLAKRVRKVSLSPDEVEGTEKDQRKNADSLQRVLTNYDVHDSDLEPVIDKDGTVRVPKTGYEDGTSLIIEDQYGEILKTVRSNRSFQSVGGRSFTRSRAGSGTTTLSVPLSTLGTSGSKSKSKPKPKAKPKLEPSREEDEEETEVEAHSEPDVKADAVLSSTTNINTATASSATSATAGALSVATSINPSQLVVSPVGDNLVVKSKLTGNTVRTYTPSDGEAYDDAVQLLTLQQRTFTMQQFLAKSLKKKQA